MALLTILEYPDPRLRKVAAPVTQFTPEVVKLVRDMAETMYAAPGVGLAATQVDVHKRVIVIDVSDTKDDLLVLVNPEIVMAEGEAECEEGCLSVPGYYDKVTRAARITVRARNERGEPIERTAEGLLAVCIQHEMDHLLGKMFVDYLSPLKRARLSAKQRKKQRPGNARAVLRLRTPSRRLCRHSSLCRAARSRRSSARAFPVPLVLTQPDRPSGRGHGGPAVARQGARAEPTGLPSCSRLRCAAPTRAPPLLGDRLDVLVVAAYGLILPPAVLAWPRLRRPQHPRVAPAALAWRGADPARDPGRRHRRPESRSCKWTPGSIPVR